MQNIKLFYEAFDLNNLKVYSSFPTLSNYPEY